MPKKCELTGKIPMKGHNVSHANNKTKRRFLPNLKKVKFTSEILKRSLKLTVSNAGVRSVDKKGSFDDFLKTVKKGVIVSLSKRIKRIKNVNMYIRIGAKIFLLHTLLLSHIRLLYKTGLGSLTLKYFKGIC